MDKKELSKICSRCNLEQSINNFSKIKNGIKLHSHCKACNKFYYKKYFDANKEKIKQRTKQYRKDNAEAIKIKKREYYDKNILMFKEKGRKRYLKEKETLLAQRREYYKKNIVKEREIRRLYRLKQTKDTLKSYQIKKYNLTIEDFKNLLEKQQGKCYICKGSSMPNKNLAIDHCHETGKVRGLLCHMCNRGLGYFKDNVNLLHDAINYLNMNKGQL